MKKDNTQNDPHWPVPIGWAPADWADELRNRIARCLFPEARARLEVRLRATERVVSKQKEALRYGRSESR
jgi:hypothetical protein